MMHQSAGSCSFTVDPLKYGDFLFPGRRTCNPREQYRPDIIEFSDIVETDDHSIPLEELVARLDTDSENGLKEDQVNSIREIYGYNTISEPPGGLLVGKIHRIRGTYSFLLAGIIFCIITVSVPSLRPPAPHSLDSIYLGTLMVLMIIVSASVSIWQEKLSHKMMQLFKDLYPQYASVIRDGIKVRLHRRDIVVGDLVLLKAGCNVPADIRITESWNLKVDDLPVVCSPGPTVKRPECTSDNPIESRNVCFYGTLCLEGCGQGIAVSTGDRTAYGRIMKKMTILQKMETTTFTEMRKILKLFGTVTLVTGAILLILILLRGNWWVMVILLILCQVVTSMPDIMYSVITACFYHATTRMVSKNCLPKDFEAVEKMGSITVICCDKTGTITQNRMTVVRVWQDDKVIVVEPSEDREEMKLLSLPHIDTWRAFTRAAALCSSTTNKFRRNFCVIRKGCSCDPSEVAILEFVNNSRRGDSRILNVEEIREGYKKVYEIPFNSYKKYHVTIHEKTPTNATSHEDFEYLICIKGAVEEILKLCTTFMINGRMELISALDSLDFQRQLDIVMKNGERTFGFCDYPIPKDRYPSGHVFQAKDIPTTGLRFLGFVSMMDPPRASIPGSIQRCRDAGIKVILMTEDHPIVAKAIAKQVGIISPKSKTAEDIMQQYNITLEEVTPGNCNLKAAVVNGSELDFMEPDHLLQLLREYEELVFARITPRQKIRITEMLRSTGEVVAVTGDSVEDSVAMHKADIGIGMAMHGCDMSREIADVILLGDNLDSIVSAIEEGQVTYSNLRRAMVYVLSSNLPEISPLFIVGLFHVPFTLGATFILFITLIAETFQVLTLAYEGPDGDVLLQPKIGHLNFFDHRVVQKSYCQTGVIGFLSGLFVYTIIMAKNGFLPFLMVGIAERWDSPSINDLRDSFNQEWAYSSRKTLEYNCQTAFFVSIIILQFFNFVMYKTKIYGRDHRKMCSHVLNCFLCIPGIQVLIILLLMYTPGLSTVLHFYPLKINDWLMCLPFPLLFLALEGLRRYTIRNSGANSWFVTETI